MRTEQEIRAALAELEEVYSKVDKQRTGRMLTLLVQELTLKWCLGEIDHLYQWKGEAQ